MPAEQNPPSGDPAGHDTRGRSDRAPLRVGDAERNEVIVLVQHAVADGRLSLSEGKERIDRAQTARTFGDLDPLVADLTPVLPSAGLEAGQLAATNRPLHQVPEVEDDEPGWDVNDPLVVSVGGWSARRTGRWQVPPFIRAEPGSGFVTLNMLEATPQSRTITVHIVSGIGFVRLILPDGWAVRADRLTRNILSTVWIRVGDKPSYGKPLVVLTGEVNANTVIARRATAWEKWRLARRRAQRAARGELET